MGVVLRISRRRRVPYRHDREGQCSFMGKFAPFGRTKWIPHLSTGVGFIAVTRVLSRRSAQIHHPWRASDEIEPGIVRRRSEKRHACPRHSIACTSCPNRRGRAHSGTRPALHRAPLPPSYQPTAPTELTPAPHRPTHPATVWQLPTDRHPPTTPWTTRAGFPAGGSTTLLTDWRQLAWRLARASPPGPAGA